MYTQLAKLPRKLKLLIVLTCDVILLPFALWSAIALRYGTLHPPDIMSYWWIFVLVPFITVPIFIRVGLYRAVVRYVDEKVLYTVVYGVSLSVLLLTAAILLGRVVGLPRSSILIYWMLSVTYITASRYLGRGLLRTLEKGQRKRMKVAIYGAGRAGLQTAMALLSGSEYSPVLFFDDAKDLQGSALLGIRVYDPQMALTLMEQYGCNQLLLAMPSVSRSRRKEIIENFESKGIQLKTIPGMGDLVDGKVKIEDIREVGVEDLLGRDPVPPFENLLERCIREKAVLVTGAGGSIGSELCRQILRHSPTLLVLFEQNEYALYKIEQDIRNQFPNAQVYPVLGDVLNQASVEREISKYNIQTIYHAAAYKHVPLVEDNVGAGVMNNVFGTFSVAMAAIEKKVENFVLISTDKAVRPTNVMGATKRLAELVLQGLSQISGHQTRFCMVRFGNVLGSSGSVVPRFKEQIALGGPVTVTHPDVTRYFMTIPEAAQLVLQAGGMATGGDVFVLDMGEPVKIVDLAKKMIELSGFEVRDPKTLRGDIAIEFVGLRPGEKLYEELLIGTNSTWTSHPRIMRAEESLLEWSYLTNRLLEMRKLCSDDRAAEIKAMLKELVKEYSSGAS